MVSDIGKGRLENDEVECMVSNIIYKVHHPIQECIRQLLTSLSCRT